MVSFLLANRFPMLLWWGPTFCSHLQRRVPRRSSATKHPWALGRPVSECWSEIWHVLKPLIETPFHGGPATWIEDFELEINRHGFVEETHFTVAYSPVPDETAPRGIGGVLATVHEITDEGGRRAARGRAAGPRIARAARRRPRRRPARSPRRRWRRHGKDLPFALLYLIDADGKTATPGRCRGRARRARTISPLSVELGEPTTERRAGRSRDASARADACRWSRPRRALWPACRAVRGPTRRTRRVVMPIPSNKARRARRLPGGRRQPAPDARRALSRLPRPARDAARHRRRQRPRLRGGDGSGPRRWPSSTGPRPPSSATSATSSARR